MRTAGAFELTDRLRGVRISAGRFERRAPA
jgi:hypothetical protein